MKTLLFKLNLESPTVKELLDELWFNTNYMYHQLYTHII